MRPSSMHYFPLAWPFLLALTLLFFAVVALVELGLLKYAYERMGVPPRYVFAVLLFSLLGSAVNIPVVELPPERMVSGRVVDFFGVSYVVPVVQESPGTIIAVNVGGALIPVILSLYLLFKNKFYARALVAVIAVALVVHLFRLSFAWSRHQRSDLYPTLGRGIRRHGAGVAPGRSAGVHRGKPGHIDWRRPAEFRQSPGSGSAHRVDRRSRYVRRRLFDRNHRRFTLAGSGTAGAQDRRWRQPGF